MNNNNDRNNINNRNDTNYINIISIEGNVGSGKSTAVNSLKELYKNNNRIYFLEEPVNEWINIKDESGKDIIEKFYENQEKYSFSFQIMAYISRLSMLKNAINYCKLNNIKLIVCERSLNTDKNVFCKMLKDSGKIEDINYQIYLKWFNDFITEIPKTYYVYIKTDPKIAFDRVIKRNRKGENISLEYLTMCSNYHDTWLNIRETIIINGNDVSLSTFEQINNVICTFLS